MHLFDLINNFHFFFQGTVIAIIAVLEFSKFLKNKLQPVTFDSILREPYGVKGLRKMIDGCAFRIYGHWVKRNKDENQNRGALFENKPHKEKYNGNGHTTRKTGILDSYNASFRMSSLGLIQYKSSVRQKAVQHWQQVLRTLDVCCLFMESLIEILSRCSSVPLLLPKLLVLEHKNLWDMDAEEKCFYTRVFVLISTERLMQVTIWPGKSVLNQWRFVFPPTGYPVSSDVFFVYLKNLINVCSGVSQLWMIFANNLRHINFFH